MSLCATYVESQEGHWYKNPIVKGDGWFICWDDDDPIEIVVEKHISIRTVLTQLYNQGWDLVVAGKPVYGAQRLFDGDFKPATAQFVKQKKLGPTDRMLEGNERLPSKPRGDGVYYNNSSNGNGGYS